MYKDIPAELRRIVEPVVLDHELELVDAGIRPGRGQARLSIVLDTQQGDGRVTADQCAAVSREVAHGLEASDLLPGRYTLEVSSPGVDRVLGREKDFERVVGQKVAVETREPLDGRQRFKGELLAFEAGSARIRTSAGEFSIAFDDLLRAKAFCPFDPLHKSAR